MSSTTNLLYPRENPAPFLIIVIGASGFEDVHVGSNVAPSTKLSLCFVFRGVYPNRIDWPNLPSKITSPRYGCS